MDTPYVPISCALHDRLLDLATRRQESDFLISHGDDEPDHVHGTIVDVFSRSGAEFLQLEDGRTFRLDTVGIDDPN